jgi:hypothetical protein
MITAQAKSLHRTSAFSVAMAIVATATVFAGFAPSYFLKSVLHTTRFPTGRTIPDSLPALVHVHALIFSAWLVLLIVQVSLSATGRLRIHRKLGVVGALLALAMVTLGFATAIRGARDGWNPGGPFSDPLAFMAVGLGDIVVFAGFIGAGLLYRRRPEVHKRLMVLGTLGGLMWPAITRIPHVAPNFPLMFALYALLVFAFAARDWVLTRRVHPVSLWGGVLILATVPARTVIAHTVLWHRVAEFLIR